ncbi:MAG: CRISPR-associated protein Csn1 [Bacteroidaceae bacterium]|nr:CRISPR-associated protein Csn1 [Bacteroidaceae bacterium]
MAKILGIDLGTNSIGWAITEENDGIYSLIDKGVNIFQEGVAYDKNNEKPMVAKRTEARSLRRHYFRRRLRKIEILKVLIKNKLCPMLSDEELKRWKQKKQFPLNQDFMLWLRTDDKYNKNPYSDRYKALTEKLDLENIQERYILGRAIYHIGQRRGFLSNRKDTTKEDESGKVKSSIKNLDEAISNAGCKYLGEFFYKLYQKKERIRNGFDEEGYGYAYRKNHYLKEFEAICQQQGLCDEIQASLYRAIFFQRPLKSQKGTVGNCTFEKGKARCPVSHPKFEEFRMLQFINSIKIQTPNDETLRELTPEERNVIIPLFMRKSKVHFDFEEIAKKLCGNKKNSYGFCKDKELKEYLFNYKLETTVTGCPTTASLINLFGEEWVEHLCSIYRKADKKSKEEIINDIWHILFSFDDNDKVREWGITNLQLSPEEAKKFSDINIVQGYSSMSLNAINKTLPYLRAGYRYDQAIFLANLKNVVGENRWNNDESRNRIINSICTAVNEFSFTKRVEKTKKEFIQRILLDEFGIEREYSDKLYHPSQVEGFSNAAINHAGTLLLGSPRTSSIRNPMVMRSLFRLRILINTLLSNKSIDTDTRINIEMARELNDANKRAAIKQYQKELEDNRRKYSKEISEKYLEETGKRIVPTEDDILKYQLWEEQGHKCLYTGENIGICDFIGADSKYDIEHTIPRSRGGDDSQANKTLCNSNFNRQVKRAKLPCELDSIFEVRVRIEELGWTKKVEELEKQISLQIKKSKNATTKESKDNAIRQRHFLKLKLDYWKDKTCRFNQTEVNNGFSKRQGVDIGIISRYARMYLHTVFNNVHTVKGSTTADFRKMWGLQDIYAKKERNNHVHHCIDAITIACIGHGAYDKWKRYNEENDNHKFARCGKPIVEKPWSTFTEDVKNIAEEILISHHTANNTPKQSKKRMRIRGAVQHNENHETKYQQGDTARVSLHKDTFYGAIKKDDEIKYVVRKALSSLEESDVEKIVDDAIKQCVRNAVKTEGFKAAMSKPICFNREKGVYIKKVRIYAPSVKQPIHLKQHQQLSKHDYKQNYHVVNDSNHCIAIYEGTDEKGRLKRGFKVVSNIEAVRFFNGKLNRHHLVPLSDENDLPLKYILRIGTMVLFYEKSPAELIDCNNAELCKRLYKITGFSEQIVSGIYHYGTMTLKHHQEARPAGELKAKGGDWKCNEEYRPVIGIKHTQFNAYVEGYDFDLTVTGEIKFKL